MIETIIGAIAVAGWIACKIEERKKRSLILMHLIGSI